jgi:hypothetical protein
MCLLYLCHYIFYFILMIALVFYFVGKCHSKFKFEFDSNEIEIYKNI